MVIAIENVWNNFMLSPVESAQFVDSFNSKYVGWHFDVGNVIRIDWPSNGSARWARASRSCIKEYSRAKADKQGKWAGFDVEFLKGRQQLARGEEGARRHQLPRLGHRAEQEAPEARPG